MLAYKWMVAHDCRAAGEPYLLPTPADLPNALAERDALALRLDDAADIIANSFEAEQPVDTVQAAIWLTRYEQAGEARVVDRCTAGTTSSYSDPHHCQLAAGHEGDHRDGNYFWQEVGITVSAVERRLPNCQKCGKPSQALTNGYCDPCIVMVFARES